MPFQIQCKSSKCGYPEGWNRKHPVRYPGSTAAKHGVHAGKSDAGSPQQAANRRQAMQQMKQLNCFIFVPVMV